LAWQSLSLTNLSPNGLIAVTKHFTKLKIVGEIKLFALNKYG
jgi:hypothetical protein